MATNQERLAIAWKMIQAGDLAGARGHLLGLTSVDQSFAQAWYLLGSVNQLLGNTTESLANYERVLRTRARSYRNTEQCGGGASGTGNVQGSGGQLANRPPAQTRLRRGPQQSRQCPQGPRRSRSGGRLLPASHRDRSQLLRRLQQPGNGLRAQGNLAESVRCYEKALALKPDNPEMHLNRALAWLQMGDFERGWPEYEWRLKCREFRDSANCGTAVGRQSARGSDDLAVRRPWPRRHDSVHSLCAPGPRARGACDRGLSKTDCPRCWRAARASEQVVPEGSLLPEFAVHAPLMSLPLIFGTTSELGAGSCSLSVSRRRARQPLAGSSWARRAAFKIGVAWQGNPTYRRDRERSFRLAELERVAKTPGVELVSFQRIHGLEQLGEIESQFAVTTHRRTTERLHGHRGGYAIARSGDHSGHVAGSSRRCAWRSRLASAFVRSRLAMAAETVGQSLVSFDATVPARAMGRLGPSLRADGGGAAAFDRSAGR